MTETKNLGGRPSKYKNKYCQEIIDFYDVEPWEEREIPHMKGGELVWTDIKIIPTRRPTIRRFAKKIGICLATVYNWLNSEHQSYHKDFSHAYVHGCKYLIKDFLIDGALAGITPPASFKFIAVNMTDMRDKVNLEGDGFTSLATALAGLVKDGKDDVKKTT